MAASAMAAIAYADTVTMAKREHEKSLASLLTSSHIRDLIRQKQNVITIEHNASLSEALEQLDTEKLQAAPVVLAASLEDNDGDTYMGVLDYDAVIRILIQDVLHSVDKDKETAERWDKLTSLVPDFLKRRVITVMSSDVDLKFRGGHNDHLLELINGGFLGEAAPDASVSQHEVHHRIAVFNERGHIVHIVSMSDIVRFLNKHNDKLGTVGRMTMKDLGVTNKHVVKVTSSTKVIDAFNSMQEAKRRGAAVVDEKEEFLFDLSAKDLKDVNSKTLDRLLLPVSEYAAIASKRNAKGHCTEKTTLAEVIALVSEHHVHRVYVLDDSKHVVGVISLTDILRIVAEASLK